jgi:hypothetical protein
MIIEDDDMHLTLSLFCLKCYEGNLLKISFVGVRANLHCSFQHCGQ